MLHLIVLLLLFVSWLQPMHIPPWPSWHSEFLAFVAMFLLGAGQLFKRDIANRYVYIPRAAWMFLALITILVVQASFGLIGFVGDVLVISTYLVLCIVGLSAGYQLQNELNNSDGPSLKIDNALARFAVGCLFVAAVSALVCLAQSLEVWSNGGWFERAPDPRRPGANLGQANQLATLLVMGLACLIYLYELGRLKALGSIALYVLIAMGLAATASRSGLISFILLTFWWHFGSGRSMRKASWLATACASLLLGVWVVYWPSGVVAVQEGASGLDLSQNHINVSGQSRFAIWEQLLSAVWQRPWFGWGIREVAAAHNAVVDAFAQSAPFTYSHSVILDLAIGVGIPLAAGFVCVSAWWLIKQIRAAESRMAWICLAFMLPFVIHSLFEFPFAYAYFLLPVCVAMGVLEASIKAPVVRLWRGLTTLCFTIFIVLFGWSVYEYSVLEEDFRVARFEALRIGSTPAEYEKPKVRLLTQLGALVWASRLSPSGEMAQQDLDTLRRVALHFPWTATQNRYALALALNGNPTEAMRQLQVMRSMHGNRTFELLMENWVELSNGRFPQLKTIGIFDQIDAKNH